MEVTPALVLAMWTAGMAGGGALVSYWAIVGPGFGWLTSGVVVVVGGATAFAGDTFVGLVATVFALGAGVTARHHRLAAALFAAASLGYLAVAVPEGSDRLDHWCLLPRRDDNRDVARSLVLD